MVLPVDFHTALRIKKEEIINSSNLLEERPTSRSQEENSGSNAKNQQAPPAKGGKPNPVPQPVVEVAPEPVKEVIPSVEAKIWLE